MAGPIPEVLGWKAVVVPALSVRGFASEIFEAIANRVAPMDGGSIAA